MKTSLAHLPESKQQQILQITDIIKEVVVPEKIILFGSYATGTWVEDEYYEDGIRFSYISDYDFLVVAKNSEEKEHILTDKIVNRSRHLTEVAVNCIIHDIGYINEGLSFGQYFFADIVKDGVLLHDSGKVDFVQPKELTPKEQSEIALRYFNQWFTSGIEFIDLAEYANKKTNLRSLHFFYIKQQKTFTTPSSLFSAATNPKPTASKSSGNMPSLIPKS